MNRLATAYDVPIEIIAAVGYLESGLFQYGTDGFLVHNLTECRLSNAGTGSNLQRPPGLGLFQLTGSTATGFNLNRLVSDWRYNLEAGVITLSKKYEAALAPDPDPIKGLERTNRRVLENWIYAIRYYVGTQEPKSTQYLDAILNLIANPPSRIQGFFPSVQITLPSAVISGYQLYAAYVALPDGTWLNAAGTQFTGAVHLTGGSAPSVAPIITAQPVSQVAPVGGSATFTVAAVGTAPLTYQWRHHGTIVGGNSPTLNLGNVTTTDRGSYTVTIANSVGSVASQLVTLTVNTSGVLRIADGIKLVETPPFFIGDSPATVDATIKNVTGSTVYLNRIQVDGDFLDSSGALLNTVSWNAENFATPLAIPSGGTYRHVSSHSQSPFPGVPAKVTARLKVKFNGIPGLSEVTDAEGNASAILAFETLDKYQLSVDPSPYGSFTKIPDLNYYGSGTQLQLAATPNQGYVFARWINPNASTFSENNPVTITMTRNTGLRAVFEPMTPRINVSVANGTATLTWPDWGTAFQLEAADALTLPLVWNVAGTTPALLGNTWNATLPVGNATKIFRLRKP